MSIDNPTPHEIRISSNLQRIALRLTKELKKATGGPCGFILMAWPAETQMDKAKGAGEQPIASYIATGDRESCAMSMMELIAHWQNENTLPPIHEMRDANGRSFAEILGAGPH